MVKALGLFKSNDPIEDFLRYAETTNLKEEEKDTDDFSNDILITLQNPVGKIVDNLESKKKGIFRISEIIGSKDEDSNIDYGDHLYEEKDRVSHDIIEHSETRFIQKITNGSALERKADIREIIVSDLKVIPPKLKTIEKDLGKYHAQMFELFFYSKKGLMKEMDFSPIILYEYIQPIFSTFEESYKLYEDFLPENIKKSAQITKTDLNDRTLNYTFQLLEIYIEICLIKNNPDNKLIQIIIRTIQVTYSICRPDEISQENFENIINEFHNIQQWMKKNPIKKTKDSMSKALIEATVGDSSIDITTIKRYKDSKYYEKIESISCDAEKSSLRTLVLKRPKIFLQNTCGVPVIDFIISEKFDKNYIKEIDDFLSKIPLNRWGNSEILAFIKAKIIQLLYITDLKKEEILAISKLTQNSDLDVSTLKKLSRNDISILLEADYETQSQILKDNIDIKAFNTLSKKTQEIKDLLPYIPESDNKESLKKLLDNIAPNTSIPELKNLISETIDNKIIINSRLLKRNLEKISTPDDITQLHSHLLSSDGIDTKEEMLQKLLALEETLRKQFLNTIDDNPKITLFGVYTSIKEYGELTDFLMYIADYNAWEGDDFNEAYDMYLEEKKNEQNNCTKIESVEGFYHITNDEETQKILDKGLKYKIVKMIDKTTSNMSEIVRNDFVNFIVDNTSEILNHAHISDRFQLLSGVITLFKNKDVFKFEKPEKLFRFCIFGEMTLDTFKQLSKTVDDFEIKDVNYEVFISTILRCIKNNDPIFLEELDYSTLTKKSELCRKFGISYDKNPLATSELKQKIEKILEKIFCDFKGNFLSSTKNTESGLGSGSHVNIYRKMLYNLKQSNDEKDTEYIIRLCDINWKKIHDKIENSEKRTNSILNSIPDRTYDFFDCIKIFHQDIIKKTPTHNNEDLSILETFWEDEIIPLLKE